MKLEPHSAMMIDSARLPSLALVGATRLAQLFARTLLLGLALLVPLLALAPWQQFISGKGRVIAFNPLDRRVNVEAPVSGRVKKLYVTENQKVKKGEILVEIQDNDPNLLTNLRLQYDAAISRRGAAQQRILDLDSQIEQMTRAKSQAISGAEQLVQSAEFSVNTNQLNYERMQKLLKPGYVSQRDYELAKLALDSASASLLSARATLSRTREDLDASISSIRANRSSAEAELATAMREITAVNSLISQAQQQVIEAPREGVVHSVAVTDGTFLRPGSPICVVIPETESRFVELTVKGMDMPLISQRRVLEDGTVIPGSPVRLQFEGWPAIQFVGWPSVAVGTFGGDVVFIDPTDDGYGRFRIVVAAKPDEFERDGKKMVTEWPGNRWLRQGVRAKGWVLLERVPLWKEIWRQLNGFPPVVKESDSGGSFLDGPVSTKK